ncbi:sortilin-related receptor-like, partial [Paramuricea clavata]
NSSCSGKICSQLCLPKPNNKYVCACGDDLELDPKTGKCKCVGGLITLKNGTCIRQAGKSCAAHEFPCRNGRCIPFDLKCDFHNDCGDYSDEDTGCDGMKVCNDKQFHCPGGQCIPVNYVCDGDKDCEDGYDEKPCKNRTRCPQGKFRCGDGVCIPRNARCDGDRDCKDNSDEHLCPGFG